MIGNLRKLMIGLEIIRAPIYFTVSIAAILCLSGVPSHAAKRASATSDNTTANIPAIYNVYVAYRTLGEDNRAFPLHTSSIVVKAIVIGYINGEKGHILI